MVAVTDANFTLQLVICETDGMTKINQESPGPPVVNSLLRTTASGTIHVAHLPLVSILLHFCEAELVKQLAFVRQ
jgi:hypothetical protein